MNEPITYFSEDKKSTGIIVDLLHAVYNHYPVGYPHYIDRYPGYLKMREIVGKKLGVECNDINSISNKFAEAIRSSLPRYDIENKNYLNFPNYSFVLPISNEDLGTVIHKFDLNLVISLLCDYYTIVFVDTYRTRGIARDGVTPNSFVSSHSIFSYSSSIGRVSDDIVLLLTETIKKYFPDKKYVHHALLMEPPFIARIAPFTEVYNPDKSSSFWELLFSNDSTDGAVILD
jgi:hypothetical protein